MGASSHGLNWTDPRTNPSPPYAGPERPLALDKDELAGLIAALRQGRFYDLESWVREGRPLQADPQAPSSRRPHPTPLHLAIRGGQVDVVRLFLCNGYRTELEPDSPLNAVLDARRWDLLEDSKRFAILSAILRTVAGKNKSLSEAGVGDLYQETVDDAVWNLDEIDRLEGEITSLKVLRSRRVEALDF